MKTILTVIFLLFSTGLFAETDNSRAVWLDVRTTEEYATGHIEGAINIPHNEIAQRIAELDLDKATPIVLYCKSGRRAGIALETLTNMGYSQVTNEGGYEAIKQKLADDNERQ